MIPEEKNPRLDRAKFQLRTSGLKSEMPQPLRSGVHTRGYLPHVKREGHRYFVTFRLADSLPREILLRYQAERASDLERFHALEKLSKTGDESIEKIERRYFRKLEQFLDGNTGECWLRRPDIAQVVADALRFFDNDRYILSAWVIMPNHVHIVLWPIPNHTLSDILKTWKRFTAREANKLLKRTGKSFWQPESYDHWIRSDDEHERSRRYVLNNPVKAGLCKAPENWPWSSAFRSADL